MKDKKRKTSSQGKKTEVAPQSPVEKKIHKILKADREREISLEHLYKTLDGSEKVRFKDILRTLATSGIPDEQVVAMNTIILLEDRALAEDIIEYHLQHTKLCPTKDDSHNLVISTLGYLIYLFKFAQYLKFCEKVLKYSLELKDNYMYSAYFSALMVIDWRSGLGEIKRVIRGDVLNSDGSSIISVLAFFKLEHKAKEWKELLSLLSDEERQIVSSFKDRIKEHYDMLREV